MIKAPQFWHKKILISFLLLPLSWLYGIAVIWRYLLITPKKINKPIICIGNLIAGGAGKTPVAIAIGLMLRDKNIDFAYLSYGYGRKSDRFLQVSSSGTSAIEAGDEPILLSEVYDTFVSSNRVVGAKKIAAMKEKQLIILDDGFQNPSLFKDLHILVVDGGYGFGNEFLMPAGPLREPISFGVRRADLVIIIGEDKANIAGYFTHKEVVYGKIIPVNNEKFTGKNVIAFCGIGRPEKFFDSLKDVGAQIIKKISYADHYLYSNQDLDYLISLAREHNAKLVTTKKDWVRIDPQYQDKIEFLDIKIEFDNPDLVKQKVLNILQK